MGIYQPPPPKHDGGWGATPQMGMYQSPPPFIVLGEKE